MSGNELKKVDPEKQNIFRRMEHFDELQILNPELRDKFVYKIRRWNESKKQYEEITQLSYAGIKQIILEISQEGQPMEVLREIAYRDRIDDNPQHDIWYCSVVLRNKKTGHETWGVSEEPVYLEYDKKEKDANGAYVKDQDGKIKTQHVIEYDPFGRTKSVSKAVRNAERGQIPELTLNFFIEKWTKTGKVHDLSNNETKPTTETRPATATKIDYCQCKEPKPRFVDNVCYECKKEVEPSVAEKLLKGGS